MSEMTFPHTHTFRRPVDALGDTQEGLTLREPTAGDLLKFGVLDGTLDGERIIDLIAALSGKPQPLLKALPGVEILSLSKKLTDFFRSAAA